MCAEQRASLGIRIELADTTVILKRPAVGDIAVLLGDRHEGTLLEILKSSADRGDLWVAEYRRRYPLVRKRAEIVGVRQVVRDRTGFGISHMLQLERRAAVAERPDARRGAPELVHHDVSVLRECHSREVELEIVGIWLATGRHQQQLPHHTLAIVEDHFDSGAMSDDVGDRSVEMDVPAGRNEGGKPPCDVRVEVCHQSRGHFHDVDLNSETGKHVRQLYGDVSPAENDHARRPRVESHDGVRRMERHPRLRHYGRNSRVAASRDHDLCRFDTGPILDYQLMWTGEADILFEDSDVRLGPLLSLRGFSLLHPSDNPISDGRPVNALERCTKSELRRSTGLHRQICGVDEHLGGDTSTVEAGPPKGAGLNERDSAPIEVVGDYDASRTGADDCEIELFHRRSLRADVRRPTFARTPHLALRPTPLF